MLYEPVAHWAFLWQLHLLHRDGGRKNPRHFGRGPCGSVQCRRYSHHYRAFLSIPDFWYPHMGLRRTAGGLGGRSEEHTSELQSRGHLVCRRLLEKKKQETVDQIRPIGIKVQHEHSQK